MIDALLKLRRVQASEMNDRGKELYLEILRLCDGADAVQAITALTTALGFVVVNAATEDRRRDPDLGDQREGNARARRQPADPARQLIAGHRLRRPWPPRP